MYLACQRAVLRSSSASCLLLTLFSAPPRLVPPCSKARGSWRSPCGAWRRSAGPWKSSWSAETSWSGTCLAYHASRCVRAQLFGLHLCPAASSPAFFIRPVSLHQACAFSQGSRALPPPACNKCLMSWCAAFSCTPLQRPQSAVARTMEVLGPEAMLQLRTSTTAAPTAGTHTAYTQAGAHGQSSYLSHLGGASSASLAASAAGGGRPQSAPVKRPASAAPSAYQSSAVDAAAGGTVRYKQPEAQVGATPRRPHSAVQRTGQRDRAVHITQRPTGDHWSLYSTAPQAQVQSVQGAPTLGGALVAAVGSGTGTGTAGAGGAAAGSGAWTPPKKSAIEASFLSRLQRSASCRG